MPVDDIATTRLHEFDALRAFALLLGILLHAALSYAPGSSAFWIVPDASTGLVAGLAFYVPHMFRMILFFLISGFFSAMLFGRLGKRAFLIQRFKRITLVLMLFWFPTLAGTVISLIAGYALGGGPLVNGPPPPLPSFTPNDFPLTHLWFLWQLTLVTGAFCVTRAVIEKIGLLDATARIGQSLAALAVRYSFGVLAAAPLALALALDPHWLPWFGIATPDRLLYPPVATLCAYWLAFAIGWAVQRRMDILSALEARAPWHLAVAGVATAMCLAIAGLRPNLAVGSIAASWPGYAVLYATAGWQWTFGLIGASRRWLSSHNKAIRYISDASYWLYITHLPVVLFLQALLVHVSLPWPIKLTLVLGASLSGLTLVYDVAVRPTWLGAMLNGRRRQSLLLPRYRLTIGA